MWYYSVFYDLCEYEKSKFCDPPYFQYILVVLDLNKNKPSKSSDC